jgi:hypothetical protein
VVVALTASYDDQGRPTTFELSERSRQALSGALPEADTSELRAVVAANTPGGSTEWEFYGGPRGPDFYTGAPVAVVADEPVLASIGADAELRDGLAEHGLVALTATADVGEGEIWVPDGRRLPAALVHSRHHLGYAADILISEQRAGELGLTIRSAGALLRLEQPITDAQRDTLEELSYDFTSEASGLDVGVGLGWHDGSTRPSPFLMEVVLAGVALLFCLFVVGVSLALAAAEGKDERDILTIAGAPPAAIARSAGARAWLMASVGAVIAVPIGFLPVVVVAWASHRDPHASQPFPVIFPTRTVLLLVVIVPLVVCAVAWLASSTAQRLRPVRVSTAAFE